MASTEERLHQLVLGLLQATKKGRLKWEPADADRDNFEVDLPSGSVNIVDSKAQGSPGGPYALHVYNENGAYVESLRSQWAPEAAPWNADLEALFKLAFESAINVNGVIDGLLRDIEA